MNVKLTHDINFSSIVVDGARIFPNSYYVKINMITATDNSAHQNIAIQRFLIFINEIMADSIFCFRDDPIAPKIFRLMKENRVILFPEEPYDQVIGFILFHKLSAITEGNIDIDSILISSNIAPDLTYTVEDFGSFSYDKTKIEIPWWDRSDISITDNPKQLKFLSSWADINLDWDQNENKEVLDIELKTNDNKNTDIIVVDGGASLEE